MQYIILIQKVFLNVNIVNFDSVSILTLQLKL
jgi:hypothetical protein